MKAIVFLILFLSSLGSLQASPLRIVEAAKEEKADTLREMPTLLVFSRTAGFRHSSIPAGVEAIRGLARQYGWKVDWTENPARFNDSILSRYQVLIFLNTVGDVLNDSQQEAFETFIRSGKGFVGVHAAADTEHEWPFYKKLIGRQFVTHPAPQTATLYPLTADFAGLDGFRDSLSFYEEWYEYTEPYSDSLRYLIRVDTHSYDTRSASGPSKMGAFHPISWYQEMEGARIFYTGLGHMDATYQHPAFLQHLAAGISWAIDGRRVSPQALRFGGLRTCIYYVPDMQQGITWYAQAFGTSPYFVEPYYAGFAIADFELGLMPLPASAKTQPEPPPANLPRDPKKKSPLRPDIQSVSPVAYWTCEDVNATYQSLLILGASKVEAPESVGEGIEAAVVRDPWGNLIGLISKAP